jgi:hypothetical protein
MAEAAMKRKEAAMRQAAGQPLVSAFTDRSGTIEIDRIVDDFGISKSQLAATTGMARESLSKSARNRSPKVQTRLREMLEIVGRVSDWAGGRQQAMSWYRAQPIPAFGGRTAEALVKEGRAAELRDYLDHLALGGFA